jgi:hypothetical protein
VHGVSSGGVVSLVYRSIARFHDPIDEHLVSRTLGSISGEEVDTAHYVDIR